MLGKTSRWMRLTAGELAGELSARGLAPRTVAGYVGAILCAARWCDSQGLDLDTLPGPALAAYADTKPLTFSSRTLVRFSLGHYWEIIGRTDPPLKAVRCPPQPEGYCKALEPDDVVILAKAARARRDDPGVAVCLGLYAGMRRAEIAACEWEWFSGDGWVKIMGKGAKTRRVPVHDRLAEVLALTPRRSPYLFLGYRDRPVSPATIWGWCRMVCEEAGVPVSPPHVLRHIAIATMNDETGDLRTAQHFAGHAKPSTTVIYTRATDRRLKAAVASLDY